MKFQRVIRSGLIAAAIGLLAACATPGAKIRYETNPAVSIAGYRTFGFFSPLATDKAGYEMVFTSRLKDATRRVMESKGYVYSENAGQILINFYANVEDKTEVRTVPGAPLPSINYGYFGYRTGYYMSIGAPEISTISYEEGTLTIDLVDASRKALAWQATAIGKVSKAARKNPTAAIDAIVSEMMAPIPAAGG